MTTMFDPIKVGALELPNRIVMLNEPADALRLGAIAMIAAGIVALKFLSPG